MSKNAEEMYARLLQVLKEDSNRLYMLMKHARHTCYGLSQLVHNDEQLVNLFIFLDSFLARVLRNQDLLVV